MAYQTVTLADLKVALKDRYDGVVFWTSEEAVIGLNEALRDWNVLTGRWRGTLGIDLLELQWEYSLGATLIYGANVYGLNVPFPGAGVPINAANGGTGPLVNGSITDLDLGRPTWRLETIATGGDVPAVLTYWAPISLQQIVIWPCLPLGGVGSLYVDGIAQTPVLVEDGDFVNLGEETIDILVDYALHCIAFKLGGPQWRATVPYFDAMLEAAMNENGRLKVNLKFRHAAGLDRRRDLQPSKGVPTRLEGLSLGAAQ